MFDMLEELAAIHRNVVRDDGSETVGSRSAAPTTLRPRTCGTR